MASSGRSSIATLLVAADAETAMRMRHHFQADEFHLPDRAVDLTHAETLAAGQEALSAEEFDVLLLDLDLPETTGLDALDRIVEGAPDLPTIVLTGHGERDRGNEAIEQGAQDFLVKGTIDGDRLSRTIRTAIERHRYTLELARQRDQLEFFNSILQHDILNGMNVIRMRAKLLEDTVDDAAQDHVETVLTWSDNIIDLTEKVRTVLDTVTDEADTERQPVALAPLVDQAAEQVRQMDDDVTVRVSVPADMEVLADDLLADVISNLLTNAVEHNETTDLTVTVSARMADDTVTLSVSDDGDGIPAHQRDDLFERGEKGQDSNGTGFGLYFVGTMVDNYGGDITVTESEAGGAEFRLALPAA